MVMPFSMATCPGICFAGGFVGATLPGREETRRDKLDFDPGMIGVDSGLK